MLKNLRQLCERSENKGEEEMQGPFVVPILWDIEKNNESKSLLSQFSTCFNHLLDEN